MPVYLKIISKLDMTTNYNNSSFQEAETGELSIQGCNEMLPQKKETVNWRVREISEARICCKVPHNTLMILSIYDLLRKKHLGLIGGHHDNFDLR